MDALIQFIEDWERARDQKKAVHAVFFDFAKAFESVDHQILMRLVDSLLTNWLISWIAAYISNRQQRVKIDKITSSRKPVDTGVTEGSVVGPTLFLLFIISINEAVPSKVELIKYADDLLTYTIMGTLQQSNNTPIRDRNFKWKFE
jgi:hypothetical protein